MTTINNNKSSKGGKVVVIGGGFAGLEVIACLAKANTNADLVLIDVKPYFEYIPKLSLDVIANVRGVDTAENAAEGAFMKNTLSLGNSKALTNDVGVKMCMAVSSVSPLTRTVTYKDLTGMSISLEYDYLVVSSGCSYPPPVGINPNEKSLTVGSRLAALSNTINDVRKAETILIIGGGFVGVEIAGELLAVIPKSKKVHFVVGKSGFLPNGSKSQKKYLEDFFKGFENVIIHYDRGEITAGGNATGPVTCKLLSSGEMIKCDAYLQCTGLSKPNTSFLEGCGVELSSRGFVETNDRLQAIMKNGDDSSIFAAGDVRSKSNDEYYAQHAIEEGASISGNIAKLLKSKSNAKLAAYKVGPGGTYAISLGPSDGFFSMMGYMILWGRIVPKMKWMIRKILISMKPYSPH